MLPDTMRVQYVLGGLAADTDQPMPAEMQAALRSTWRKIQQHVPDTHFNFEFWNQCVPRRSTYPACRAVLAARKQDKTRELAMIEAIQNAYYQQARNPSSRDTLLACAHDIGLNCQRFERDMDSDDIELQLQREIRLAEHLGAQGYPSLVLEANDEYFFIEIDYLDASIMLDKITSIVRTLS